MNDAMNRVMKAASIDDMRDAQARIAGLAVRTPLLRLNVEGTPAEIYLKPENLQPIGSFKIRCAGNAILRAGRGALADGVYTASSGNMAQGVAWTARHLGVKATVLVPEGAAATKLAALERLGATVKLLPFAEWWQVILSHNHADEKGLFVHPVADPAVIAGDGTIGLEILEDLPDVDTVVVPYGGGGLTSGVASAIRALRPQARVLACECDVATPVAAALAAGGPCDVPYPASFVSGIGSGSVLPQMWPMVEMLIDGSVSASLEEIAAAIRLIFERNRLVAEGAGAAPVAAALAGRAGGGKVVCVISGGNLDAQDLVTILQGGVPERG